jgi:hypothetical protein
MALKPEFKIGSLVQFQGQRVREKVPGTVVKATSVITRDEKGNATERLVYGVEVQYPDAFVRHNYVEATQLSQ